MGTPRARRPSPRGATLTVTTVPTKLAREQIKALRGKARASFILVVEDIRRRGCAAAGVRLSGEALSGICRLDLYGAWRLLTAFENSAPPVPGPGGVRGEHPERRVQVDPLVRVQHVAEFGLPGHGAPGAVEWVGRVSL